MARALASLRRSEKQHSLADPLPFRQRFAPVAPARVRASRVALTNPVKEFFMSAALILAILTPLSASAEQAISHRLVAQTFSLTDSNLQARVWSDRVPEMLKFRKYLQSTPGGADKPLVGVVYTASFEVERKQIVVSVISNNCANAGGVPNLLFCPTRVVSLSGGKLEVLGDIPDLLVTVSEGDALQSSARKATIVTYDPQIHQITFANVDGGERTELPQKVVVR
ncbi:hypothetical protein B1812_21905 (plasmid) [Methylocystis bryophila]|uniref:Uncharacterized protein n=2 Tax=Methylocystis bryophila TaxID=655015 RepID=A0A1W6N242_9HYPH|nr:hypothetical protein B1812_21905 [Methylocystis bryophila]